MTKTKFILTTNIALLLILLVASCSNQEKESTIKVKNFYYLIIDCSGSRGQYNIPKLNREVLSNILKNNFSNGGGKIWLDAIDNSYMDNELISVEIDSQVEKPIEPKQLAGQDQYIYKKDIKKYEEQLKQYKIDSANNYNLYLTKSKDFLDKAEIYLNSAYQKKDQKSDVFNELLYAIRVIKDNTLNDTQIKKSIIAFSDLKNDFALTNTSKDSLTNLIRTEKLDIEIIRVGYRGEEMRGIVTDVEDFNLLYKKLNSN